ncbi:monocarboxylate permease protein [Rutstroemia sp. NJR-2017a BBW]|nr:monocarboxylate permease protein [Rutstroemia sp. NJR-2017a BBW]
MFTFFVCSPIFGRMIDSYGPRLILVFGTIAHIFGLAMTSLTNKYYQVLLAQGIFSSIGASAIYNAGIVCVSIYFKANRAFALGIISSGSSLGGIVYPILMNNLILRIGFGWTIRGLSLLIFIVLLVANATIRSHPSYTPSSVRFSQFAAPFREYTFNLVCLGSFLFCFGIFLPSNFITIQAKSYGISPSTADYLIVALNAASLFGRILQGYIADYIGCYNIVIITTSGSGVLVLTLWLLSVNEVQLFTFAVLYGLLANAFISLSPVLVAQIATSTEFGTRIGVQYGIISFAVLLGSPVGSQLIEICHKSFVGLQVFTGVTMLISSCIFLIAKLKLSPGIFSKV